MAAVLVAALVAAGVLGYGATRGWFDSGSVEGTTSGFEPQQAPTGSQTAGSWPEWGFDAARSRANPALAIAPPFRTLHTKYPLENLEEAMAEGIVTGHPAMPEFRLDPGQIHDVLAYFRTLER